MRVRIYRPSKSVMQSGRGKARQWRLEAELATPRQPEPLMGWSGAGDTMGQIALSFESSEAAVSYAQRKGWAYSLDEAQEREITPRNYGDNFLRKKKVG